MFYSAITDINECGSNPCQYGATCNDQINQYNCTCVPGYNGTHCEIGLDFTIIELYII